MSDTKSGYPDDTDAVDFEVVLESELDLIAEQRMGCAKSNGGSVYQRARAMNLAGLSFSGGGIRSAIFNLGFLQGLANCKVVHTFDYLSTVSGGGYIGSWLSALLQRENAGMPVGEKEVETLAAKFLAAERGRKEQKENSGFPTPESKPVRFLRRYADYLDPRLGLSGDTLALISLVVRNVMVMQMLLVSMLVTGFALLLLLGGGDWVSSRSAFATADRTLGRFLGLLSVDYSEPGRWLILPAMFLLFLSLLAAILSQATRRGAAEAGKMRYLPRTTRDFLKMHPNRIIAFDVLVPALSSGVLLAIALETAAKANKPMTSGTWIVVPMIAYGLAWMTTLKNLRAWVGMLGGATTLGLILYLGIKPISALVATAPFGHAIAFAPPVALALQSLVITVHLALGGTAISEQNREWWARAGGQGMFAALGWTLAFCFILYAPPLISYGAEWSIAGGGLWGVLSWIGTRMAESADTGNKGGAFLKEVLAKVAPWIFLAGLLALVSWAFVSTLPWVTFDSCCTLATAVDSYHTSLEQNDPLTLAKIVLGGGLLFMLLLRLVDLNLFSAHSFYLNRLARTFLGASNNNRRPNLFTGFAPDDDMPLEHLKNQRPVHLINANLNLTGGEELAWQSRRGASFVFTPRYCGYSTSTTLGKAIGGYRPTEIYGGGLSLATAVAVSGAAASPNMGFHTSASVAALLTAFNLRLARWCPNPEKEQWRQRSPKWSAGPLFAELFGEANGRNAWLNLSDGGHFDNLGLYELVRRRAGLILVTDVGADGDYQFDDLAMVVRKLSVDFGVELKIHESALEDIRPPCPAPDADPSNPPRFSKSHWAFGRIDYPDGSAPGYLIYVKSSLTADDPVDIRQYRDAHPAFPHESTADQWFDEDQFEAYRHLGQHIAKKLCDLLLKNEARDEEAPNTAAIPLYRAVEQFFNEKKSSSTPLRPPEVPEGTNI